MQDRRTVDNRYAGFWAFKSEGTQARTFAPAHNTYLHVETFVLNYFKYSVRDTVIKES